MFKNIALTIALMFVAVPAFAQNSQPAPENVSQELNREIALMTDAEKVELLSNVKSGAGTSKRVREWVEIGEGIGAGLVATAERLGVAVNDFAGTPVGKLAIVLIVWSYLGSKIIGLTLGFGLLTIGNGVWYYMLRKLFGEYNEKGKFIKFDTNTFKHHEELSLIMILSSLAINIAAFISIAAS